MRCQIVVDIKRSRGFITAGVHTMSKLVERAMRNRSVRAFSDGVLIGLSAPATLFSGAHEVVCRPRPRDTVREAWEDVGANITRAMDEYEKRRFPRRGW